MAELAAELRMLSARILEGADHYSAFGS